MDQVSAMSSASDVPPEIVEHSYANPNKEDESSSNTTSSETSDSTSSSDTEQTTNVVDNDSKLEPRTRTRAPPERHVDTYAASTPKTPPGDKIKAPKRLSTSVSRKAKEPLRKRHSVGSVESISRSLRNKEKTLEKPKSFAMSPWGKLRTCACGHCEGCKREDCGECVYCLDKVKFGGPGKKKQKCLMRACERMPVKNKLANIASLQKKMAKPPPKANTDTTPQKSSPSIKEIISNALTPSLPTNTGVSTAAPNTPSVASTSAMLSSLTKVVQSITSKPNQSSTSVAPSPAITSTAKPSASINGSSPLIKNIKPLTVSTAITIATEAIAKTLQAKAAGGAKITPSTNTGRVLASVSISTPFAKITEKDKSSTPVVRNIEKDNLPKSEPTANKELVTVETGESGILKRTSSRVTTPSFKTGASWEMKMKCEQCGREKSIGMARTDRFCTRRCVIQWLKEHPDKTPKDAVGDSDAPLFSLPTSTPAVNTPDSSKASKSVPRALRNLEIDMAAPGTRLHLSENSGNEQEEENKTNTTPANDHSLAKSSDSSKRSHFSQPATSSAKRSVVTPQPMAIKKAKSIGKVHTMSSSNNSKSVKFNLNSNSVSTVVPTPPPINFTQSSGLPASISIVPLDRLTEFVKEQQKKLVGNDAPVKTDINLPKGLSRHVQDWSVADVCAYFKATRDCAEFGTIFQEQEVDGFALLKLSDQTMCRCLGVPLGKVIKVMAHIEELKKLD